MVVWGFGGNAWVFIKVVNEVFIIKANNISFLGQNCGMCL